jgi:hypothetical protein
MDEYSYLEQLKRIDPIQRLEFFTFGDVFFMVLYIFIIYFAYNSYAQSKFKNEPLLKKLFIRGLLFKMFVGLFTAFMYDYFYRRVGDTFYYLISSYALGEVLIKDPMAYLKMMTGNFTRETIYTFAGLGYYPHIDPGIFMTHRLLSPFALISFENYYITCIVVNAFMYMLNWKGFIFFNTLLPDKTKMLAVSFLFVPSVLFWSSGLFKDTFTYTFSILFLVYFYKIFFKRRLSIFNFIKIFFLGYFVFVLKTYILYSLIGAGFIWLGFQYLYKVENRMLRIMVFPTFMLISGIGGAWMLSFLASYSDDAYSSVDSMLDKAVVAQQDLKQEYYGGQAFDIGDYEPTITGALSVAPKAIIAGLFRPFLWESAKVTMVLSGLENTVILLLVFIVFFRAGPAFFFKQLSKESFLIFCFVYSLILALGIGLSTSNFGALVRFRIPLLPFLVFGLLYVYDNFKKRKAEEIIDEESDITKPLHEQFHKTIRGKR